MRFGLGSTSTWHGSFPALTAHPIGGQETEPPLSVEELYAAGFVTLAAVPPSPEAAAVSLWFPCGFEWFPWMKMQGTYAMDGPRWMDHSSPVAINGTIDA